MDEKDKSSKSKQKNLQDNGLPFFGAFTQSKPKIPMAINSLKSVLTDTNTPLFLMICSHMHFCVESLLISDSPSPFIPFSYHLCVLGFVNISPLNLSVNFDRGLFYLN